MPSSLKVGAKGGTYYVSDKGKKVYANKVPEKHEGPAHKSTAKKVASYKKKGQSTGEQINGHEVFKGAKGNNFYVSPKTGNKVLLTNSKSKSMGLGTTKKAKKPKATKKEKAPPKTAADKEKLWEAKNDVKLAKMFGDKSGAAKAKKKLDKLQGKDTGAKLGAAGMGGAPSLAHPKEKKYSGMETGDKTADGHTVFKGKKGKHFSVSPKTGHKVFITKGSAKAQGLSGSKSKSKSTSLDTKSKLTAASKDFEPLSIKAKADKQAIINSADKQWNKLNYNAQASLQHYTGSGYNSTNGGLRKPPPTNATKNKIASMDGAFKRVATEHDYQVFRGTSSNNPSRIPEVGGTYSDKGYSSTSFSKGAANEFEGYKKHKMLMTIDIPKGSKALYVDKKSKNSGEKELLVDRGAKVRIMSKKMVDGVWHVAGRLESTHNQ